MSVSISKFSERAEILTEMADELCCRMYKQKSILSNTATSYPWLINPGSQKIKQKLEKYFPEVPDLSKVAGFDAISQKESAIAVVEEFKAFQDILLDMIDFASAAKATLAVEIVEFKLSFNRTVCLLYLGLVRSYVRCFMLLSSISERRAIASLVNGASKWATSAPMTSLTEVNHLLTNSDNLHAHFADTFGPFGNTIGGSIAQLNNSVTLYYSTDQLRSKHILSPAGDVSVPISAFPSHQKLELKIGSSDSISTYPELLSGDLYAEFIIYGCIACPSVPYLGCGSAVTHALMVAASQCFFIRIYRDVLMNVHDELEKSFGAYVELPKERHQRDGVSLTKAKGAPKDHFKWNKFLKECSTLSLSCGQKHKEKRALLTAEMDSILSIIAANPGLIAPKMPVLCALASMARAELLFYCCHLHAQDNVRKDMRKYLQASDFLPLHHDISKLLHQLMEIISLLHKYHSIIVSYYSTFLSTTDLRIISGLVDEVGGVISPLGEQHESLLGSFLVDLSNIGSIPIADSCNIPPSMNKFDTKVFTDSPFNQKLRAYRLNWNRLSAVLSTSMVPVLGKSRRQSFVGATSAASSAAAAASASSNILALASRMNETVNRSRYIDDMDGIIQDYLSPHEAWWFVDRLSDEFRNSLQCQQSEVHGHLSNPNTLFIGGYFAFANCVGRNVDHSVSDESEVIAASVLRYYSTLVASLRETFLDSLHRLEELRFIFESATHPAEASARLRRTIHGKSQGGGGGHQEAYPGVESEYHERTPSGSNFSQLMRHSQHIGYIVASVGKPFVCFADVSDCKFDLVQYLKMEMECYLSAQLKGIFCPNCFGDSPVTEMTRPFVALHQAVNACHVMNQVLRNVDHYVLYSNHRTEDPLPDSAHELLRAQLFRMSLDVTISPPGTPLATTGSSSVGCDFVTRVTSWFENLISSLCGPDGTGASSTVTATATATASPPAVWIPSKNTFASFTGVSAEGHAVESFLNPSDMECLCSVLGLQGVRALDLMFINTIKAKLAALIPFFKEHEAHWQSLANAYSPSVMHTCSKIIGLNMFHQSMVSIGIILAVRKCVHAGLSATQKRFAPHVHALSAAACRAIDNDSAVAHDILRSCGLLASDCGVSIPQLVDISLMETLTGDIPVDQLELFWQILPIATALTFTTPQRWEGVNFNQTTEVFENNEHCVSLALSELLRALAYRRCMLHNGSGDLAAAAAGVPDIASLAIGDSSGANAGAAGTSDAAVVTKDTAADIGTDTGDPAAAPHIAEPLSFQDEFRHASRRFIVLSCNIQLDVRHGRLHERLHAGFPVWAMVAVLELYMRLAAPVVSLDMLEMCCPYAILHASFVDMAMSTGHRKVDQYSVAAYSNTGGRTGGNDMGGVDAGIGMATEDEPREILSREDALAVL